MALPPTENDKSPENSKLAAELERLRSEFASFRERAEGQLKEATGAVQAVREALAEAAKTAAAAAVQAAAATATAKIAADRVKEADAKATAATAKATAADRRAEAAEALAKAVKTEASEASAHVAELKAALGHDPTAPQHHNGKLPPFLTVLVRDTEFDPVCQKAIDAVLASRKADVTVLAKDIVAKGIASAIGKVSLKLGRSRISEARRHVLAAAYPDLLKTRLGDPIQVDLAKDPPGLAESLLLDLDAPGGPLDAFAELVVAGSEASLSLKLQNHERAALKTRVRESI